MKITKDNFFLSTKAIFKGCKIPKRKPDYISYNRYNEISSMYWYGTDSKGDYVIRSSNHWTNYKNFNKSKKIEGCGNIASCFWKLKTNNKENIKAGKCYLDAFKPIRSFR